MFSFWIGLPQSGKYSVAPQSSATSITPHLAALLRRCRRKQDALHQDLEFNKPGVLSATRFRGSAVDAVLEQLEICPGFGAQVFDEAQGFLRRQAAQFGCIAAE